VTDIFSQGKKYRKNYLNIFTFCYCLLHISRGALSPHNLGIWGSRIPTKKLEKVMKVLVKNHFIRHYVFCKESEKHGNLDLRILPFRSSEVHSSECLINQMCFTVSAYLYLTNILYPPETQYTMGIK
jgi:hypothetical protein